MEPLTLHDYTAAYALDALDGDEVARYEEHLATCEQCRESSRSSAAPRARSRSRSTRRRRRAELRSRILDAARAERPT